MTVRYTAAFQRQLRRLSRRYRRIRQDIQPVIERLAVGEILGDRLQGFEWSLYKVRIKNSDANRGTRGGFRMIYCLNADEKTLVLLIIYSKSEQGDIALADLGQIISQEQA